MVVDSLIISIFQVIQIIINIYTWIIIITALLSWVNPDPYNPIVQILYKLSYPAYALVRKNSNTHRKHRSCAFDYRFSLTIS